MEADADLRKNPANDARSSQSHHRSSCTFVTIHSEAPIRYLLAMAGVKEWHELQCVWIPSDLLLGNLGQCRVTAGMRASQTIVDQDWTLV